MNLRAYHLPAVHAPAESLLERDGIHAFAPALSPADVDRICRALLNARTALTRLPLARIIAAVDGAARRLKASATVDSQLVRGIAAFTGYAPAMAAHVVSRMCDDWFAPQLERLVVSELGGFDAVDGFLLRDGRRIRAVAAPLSFHVFSGNVPGVSVTSMVRALLVKSAVFGKCAAGEPLLAPHFAQLLHEQDPVVGACVAITWWRGGSDDLEAAALAHADTVIHYGSLPAITSLRERAPRHLRFVEHGPRNSFAIINGTALHDFDRIGRDLAASVSLFEQQGCVSPQTAYVIGDAAAARALAEHVARSLDVVQREFPRGRIDAAEATAVRDLRTRAEFRAIGGEAVELWAGPNLAWTVVLEPTPEFAGSCLNRTLLVQCADTVEHLVQLVTPYGDLLQTVGIDGFDEPVALALARRLTDIGATRICTIAAMPWPPLSWHHDGRGPLTELIRWADVE